MAALEEAAARDRLARSAAPAPARISPRIRIGRWLVRVGAALAAESEAARLQARRS
jgi:hypothetical protein